MKKIHALRVALKKLIPLHWPKIVHAKETITKLGKSCGSKILHPTNRNALAG